MANIKTEKGSGGKRGHSNQDNWVTHQEEKQMGRKQRRLEDKVQVRLAMAAPQVDPRDLD